ncbi:MAG TPA: hypothetical protein VFP50_01000 [Anaeromyxobacteraceae bacterium]|nr:hypothetical protein [Anaeromyxobacteraceae bacterium]
MNALALALLLAAAPAPPPSPVGAPASFALIVASNRGAALDRPPLLYADDDGAKYHALFSAVTGPARTVLLTAFDEDSARLFPALAAVTEPPTRANVLAATGRLAAAVAEARQAGRAARFYFVFAGHGDVAEGRGRLELADGPFDSEDLAALLRQVGASESHVLLDSCNSFFVVNPRRPGGRRFATPRDAATSLARRLPGVGVFLSTSAEAEVYEWSELQAGVFSHAVRSGLLGAADANRDGRITYEELAAFVETASAGVRNPAYRPQVFARGPDGQDDRTFLDLAELRGPSVVVEPSAPIRLAGRDLDGLRWFDVFAEPGLPLRLWFPGGLTGRAELERLRVGDGGGPVLEERLRVGGEGDGPWQLATLSTAPPAAGSRGTSDVFRDLFTRPFGPVAMAAWREQRAHAPEPVFGISREDGDRMGRLLEQLASSERERRTVRGAVDVAVGLGAGVFLATNIPAGNASRRLTAGVLSAGVALSGIGFGVREWLTPSEGERIQRRFAAAMADSRADQARAVADADAGLRALLQHEAEVRLPFLTLGCALVIYGAAELAAPDSLAEHPSPDTRRAIRYAGATSAAVGTGLLVSTLFADNPTEKIIAIWSREPGVRRRAELSFVPATGGGLLSVTGTF